MDGELGTFHGTKTSFWCRCISEKMRHPVRFQRNSENFWRKLPLLRGSFVLNCIPDMRSICNLGPKKFSKRFFPTSPFLDRSGRITSEKNGHLSILLRPLALAQKLELSRFMVFVSFKINLPIIKITSKKSCCWLPAFCFHGRKPATLLGSNQCQK